MKGSACHSSAEMLNKGNFGVFDINSNYFGAVIPKRLEKFKELDKRVIKCKQHVSINTSKTTSL